MGVRPLQEIVSVPHSHVSAHLSFLSLSLCLYFINWDPSSQQTSQLHLRAKAAGLPRLPGQASPSSSDPSPGDAHPLHRVPSQMVNLLSVAPSRITFVSDSFNPHVGPAGVTHLPSAKTASSGMLQGLPTLRLKSLLPVHVPSDQALQSPLPRHLPKQKRRRLSSRKRNRCQKRKIHFALLGSSTGGTPATRMRRSR